jgi:hypothetical protein
MLVRLRKSFRTRGHSLNPKTFAFSFVGWFDEHDLLDALRGRQTDMFFCSSVSPVSFFSPFRGSVGGRKGGRSVESRGESLVRRFGKSRKLVSL